MDILKLLKELESVAYSIEKKINVIDNNMSQGLLEIPELIEEIQRILPLWFYFIEQTEIGSKEMVLNILKDITDAMQASDGVLLSDALIYGLQGLMVEYCDIIRGALNEE